jgi:hypothetical protein
VSRATPIRRVVREAIGAGIRFVMVALLTSERIDPAKIACGLAPCS